MNLCHNVTDIFPPNDVRFLCIYTVTKWLLHKRLGFIDVQRLFLLHTRAPDRQLVGTSAPVVSFPITYSLEDCNLEVDWLGNHVFHVASLTLSMFNWH